MIKPADATVLVTGGAQGIGLGIARAFVGAGARVALADRDQEQLERARASLGDQAVVTTHRLDVTDPAAYAQVVDQIEDDLGPITVLCNNAGIGGAEELAEDNFGLWDDILRINLGGVINGIKVVLPRMLRRGGPGHLVNTASGAGLVQGGSPIYTGSKFAVVGISEALAAHPDLLRADIGVTVLCPGMVQTSIATNTATHHPLSTQGRQIADQLDAMLQRVGVSPEQVGQQVLEAVRTGQLFVQTDRMLADAISDRHRRLLESLPAETERDRQVAAWYADREERRAAAEETIAVLDGPNTD